MNKKVTKLMAALALLLFIAPPMVGWGQTRSELTDVMNQTWTGVTGTNYTQVTGLEGSASDAVYTVQCAGGNSSIQLRSNNNNSGIVSTTSGGTVKKVTVTWNSNTSNGRTLNVYGKNAAYSAPSDLYGSDAGTLIGTIVCGTSTELTITDSYTHIGMRSASGAMYLTEIDVTWETGGGSGGSTPTITLSDTGTGNIGNYAVNAEITRDFTVTQSNLTAPISLIATNGGTFTINNEPTNSIPVGDGSTVVTWHFTPTAVGQFTSEITASSGETSATCTYLGYAFTPHNVNIANMEHGTVMADPTSAIESTYITLTWTPDQGYELGELTIVDANNSPVSYSDFVTYYRFQMPDSDVTVNATFVEAAPTTTVTDVLTNDNTIGETTSTYKSWTATGTSGTEYSGQSAGSNGTIQLRSTGSNSGIVSTTSVGKVKKVTVTWNSGTNDARTLNVYGSNTAYTDASDLYGSNAGTLLGTLNKGEGDTELSISSDYTYVGLRSASGAMYLDEIDIDWAVSGTPAPFITADPVEIAYNATSGSIYATIDNYVEGTLAANTEADWISDFTYEQADELFEVGFTATVNPNGTARTATVTLTYTYGDSQTATKDVTVTQAGNPNVFDNISDITDAGNYRVKGMVVATSSKGFIIGDGTGYVYTYMGNTSFDYAVGDNLSISGTTSTNYGHVIQFTNAATIEAVEETNYNGEPQPTAITEVPDYSEGNHLSTYLQFEGPLTKSGNYYLVALGESQIRISYPTGDQAAELELLENKTVRVHGFFTGISTSNNTSVFTVMMESVEEIIIAEPSITVTPTTLNVDANEYEGNLSIAYENLNIAGTENFDVNFYEVDGTTSADYSEWLYAEVVYENEAYSVYYTIQANAGEARTAYLKVYVLDEDAVELESDLVAINQAEYVPSVVEENYALFTGDLVEGDYLIVYNGSAMNNEVSNNRLQYETVTITNDVITTSNAGIVWHIAPSATRDDYWTIYNASATAYAASNGTKNQAQMLADGTDDKALWTVISGETFDFVNKANAAANVNAYLRNNKSTTQNYGFACYGTGTGGALSLYKKVGPSITVAPASVNFNATGENNYQLETLNLTYENIEITNYASFDVQFYDALGEEQEDPTWIVVEVTGTNDEGYHVQCVAGDNVGEARTVYFKVFAMGDEDFVYSNLVTITQEAAPQQYDLTVEPFENLEIITFVNDEMVMEADGTIQVTEGAQVMLSIVADEGYVIETLMVNGVNHVEDIDDEFTYSFEMPAEAVTISATAVEAPTPAGGDYVRITSLDQLTDGSKVVIAARYDEEHTNGYYAMKNTLTSGKAPGVEFTSTTSENNEILPASIVEDEEVYYWTVNVTEDGYTFTNVNGDVIGYGSSGANFVMNGNKTDWSIEEGVSDQAALVSEYTGFVIKNKTTNTRAFAFSNTGVFGAYATSNMTGATYNFYLDFFVQSEVPTPTETYTLDITGYGENAGGYYLIASPVAVVTPTANNGFLTEDYDLYWFDQTQDDEWRNYEAGEFDLVSGMGYLYASQEGTTLTFTGTPYDGDGSVSLVKDDDADFSGWNLIGNPFGVSAYIDRPFYVMNQDGTELIQSNANDEIAAMQGIFVIANVDGENLTFTPEATDQSANLTLNLSQSRGAVIDRATVSFNDGRQLPKFQLNAESTKLYIPQGNNDYAVVNSNAQGEMPVNFKAQNNGTYTISVNTENLEANYLHLIDNMTGTNIDLLQTPSYTFEAKTTDYASRFRLVFNVTGVEENTTCTEPFAFFNGSEWVVSNMGEATLQVVDMLGRIVSSETVNGNYEKSLNVAPGVYMIRLINGNDVKVQKMIVK